MDAADRAAIEDAVTVERGDSAELDDTLERLVELNAVAGVEVGSAVQAARHGTHRIVMVLDSCIVTMAVLAAALAAVSLRRAMRTLEERSSELDQFAGRVAHDVLGPLSATVFALELASRRYPADEGLQSVVARGLSGVERSRRLVDGLLEFARAGGAREARSCSLPDVSNDVVADARAEAAAARIRLRVDAIDPCVVACDAGVLASMLSNLLGNAVKHMGDADEREIVVRGANMGPRCRIEIDDTGPGVPVGLEEAIFEPFVRARGDVPGAGLGLATVRRLARAHGGEVGHARRATGGSRFWLELPVDGAASSARLPRLTG
jgi:signal transduction histidine kinase